MTIPYPVQVAKLAFLTQPAPGRYVLNIQLHGDDHDHLSRVEISRAQLCNILVDGAAMAFREQQSVRLGPESLNLDEERT